MPSEDRVKAMPTAAAHAVVLVCMYQLRMRILQGAFALGGRLNAFLGTGASYAPNLDVELYHYPMSGKLFVYLNLVPRRSLVRAAKTSHVHVAKSLAKP